MINNKIYYSLLKYKGESDITLLDMQHFTISGLGEQYLYQFSKLCKKYLGDLYLKDCMLHRERWAWSIIGTATILGSYTTNKYKLGSIQTYDFYFLRIYEKNKDSFLIIPKTILGLWLYKEYKTLIKLSTTFPIPI